LIFSDGVWLHQGMDGMLDVDDFQFAVVHFVFATPFVRVEVSTSAFFSSHVFFSKRICDIVVRRTILLQKLFHVFVISSEGHI